MPRIDPVSPQMAFLRVLCLQPDTKRLVPHGFLLSDFNSLGEIERLALIDAQVVRCAAYALVPEQVLAGGQVLRAVINCG